MKNIVCIVLLCMLSGLYSCQNNVNTKSLTSGTWHVSEIEKDGTAKNNQCLLKFEPDHTVKATFKKATYKGTWTTSSKDLTDDEPLTEKDLIIDFPREAALLSIIGSFSITGQSSDTILLEGETTGDNVFTNLLLKKI